MSRWIAVGAFGMHDDQDVGDGAPLEDHVAELVERRRRGPLAEADHQEVGPQVVHVSALERVVAAPLLRAVVEQPGVGQLGVEDEERLDQQLLRPAHAVAHRAHDRMLADHHPDVAGEEEIGQRRKGEPLLVERPVEIGPLPRGCPRSASPRSAPPAWCRAAGRERRRGRRPSVLLMRKSRASGCRQDLGEQIAHLVHLGEPLSTETNCRCSRWAISRSMMSS